MKYIPDWQNKKLRCHYCGSTKSVKYEVEVFDPVIADTPTSVCACNMCAMRYSNPSAKLFKAVSDNNSGWLNDFRTRWDNDAEW